MPRLRSFLIVFAISLIGSGAYGQAKPAFEFTIANMMRGPELFGREPSAVRFTLDGKWVYFMWLEPGSDWRLATRQFRVKVGEAGAKPERVPAGEAPPLFMETGTPSPDGKKRLVTSGGDISIVDVATGAVRVITRTLDPKTNVMFSADMTQIFYTSANNIFAISLDSSYTRQLTDIRVTADAAAQVAAAGAGGAGARGGAGAVGGGGRGGGGGGGRGGAVGGAGAAVGGAAGRGATDTSAAAAAQKAALAAQQRQLFQVFRDRAFTDSLNRVDGGGRGAAAGARGGAGGRGGGGGAAAGGTGAPTPPPIRALTLAGNERLGNVSLAPSGRALILAATIPGAGASTPTLVPAWVTQSGYVEEINGRSKVGDTPGGSSRLGYMSLSTGEVKWLSLTGTGAAKPATANVVGWNDAGTAALIMSSSADYKDRWIYSITADSGKLTLLETLHDSAWIGGPCNRCAGWIDGGRRVYYVSEADGYAHLYTNTIDGTDKKQLTKGKWEVNSLALSKDRQSFYITSSEQSPFEQHFYRMPIGGGTREKITGPVGGHTVTLSPDESMIADIYSTPTRPPELFLMANKPGAAMQQITLSPTAAYLGFTWMTPEIVMVPASDGIGVPARIFRPRDMKASPNGAAVLFVHGAGYLHNVMNYWTGSYPREFMFNQYLASKGYLVMDLDYRGSAGYGRDWRTAIYRHMGGRDLQDQVDAVKYMKKNYNIDPERVGLYGGSYGGFITLMALFTEPKYFGAGAALRSVTDWAHYNHGYTAPILNLPDQDTLAYRRSSPIYFAEGLEDPLLMLHGMVDTNVEFEDIVRLTQRLIELGKPNWALAPYPVEDHGFTRPDSWTDEYTRIFNLFESTIRKGSKKLQPPGGTP